MPYIDKESRQKLVPGAVGELTYRLTVECDAYISGNYSFSTYAEVLAALEATKLEFYRRVVAPHEDRKRLENGDVYSAPRYEGSE